MKLKSKWKQSEHSSECQFKFISRRRWGRRRGWGRNRRIEIIFNKNTCEKRWRVIERETDRCRGRERVKIEREEGRRGTTHVNNKIARAWTATSRSPYRTLTRRVTVKLHIFISSNMYISLSLSVYLPFSLSLYILLYIYLPHSLSLLAVFFVDFTWSFF